MSVCRLALIGVWAVLDSVPRVGRPVAQHDDTEGDERDDQCDEEDVLEPRGASLDALTEVAQHPKADGCSRKHVAVLSGRVGDAPWISMMLVKIYNKYLS